MYLALEGEEWESQWTIFVSNFSSERWIKTCLPPETEKSPGWSSSSNLPQKAKIPNHWLLMSSFFGCCCSLLFNIYFTEACFLFFRCLVSCVLTWPKAVDLFYNFIIYCSYLEAEGLEKTFKFKQKDIADVVDVASARKVSFLIYQSIVL